MKSVVQFTLLTLAEWESGLEKNLQNEHGAKVLKWDLVENRLEDTLVASPVAVAGKLLIRGHEHLYCFGKK